MRGAAAAAAAFSVSLLSAGAHGRDTLVIADPMLRPYRGYPNVATDWVRSRIYPIIFDALTEVGEHGEISPALALSWTAESPTRWVFTLRPGVKFSNGEPFDALAVIDSVKYLQSPGGMQFAAAREVRHIVAVEKRDDMTVVFDTREPDAMLPARLRTIRIVAPKYFRERGRDVFDRQPHGTGPFVTIDIESGRLRFRANPYAWRPPKLKAITMVGVGDSVARAQAIISGAADIALNTGPGVEAEIGDAGADVVPRMIGSVDAMPFVTVMDTPFRDRRVRLAANYAVNKERLIEAFLLGATTPATQFVADGIFGFQPNKTQPFPYDPDKARALLKEAGYPDGFDTGIELWMDTADNAAVYQQVGLDLTAVGIRTEIISVPIMKWQTEGLWGGKWEAPIFNLPYTPLPSMDPLDGLISHSCLWVMPYHCNKDVVPMLDAARRAFDREERRRATEEVLDAFVDDVPAILLYPSVRFDVVSDRVAPFSAPFGFMRYDQLSFRSDKE